MTVRVNSFYTSLFYLIVNESLSILAFSVTMGGFFVAGLLIASVAPTWIFPGRLTDYYEHQESM